MEYSNSGALRSRISLGIFQLRGDDADQNHNQNQNKLRKKPDEPKLKQKPNQLENQKKTKSRIIFNQNQNETCLDFGYFVFVSIIYEGPEWMMNDDTQCDCVW